MILLSGGLGLLDCFGVILDYLADLLLIIEVSFRAFVGLFLDLVASVMQKLYGLNISEMHFKGLILVF